MIEDPVVNEIRAGREQYAAKFNFDVRAIARDLRERQQAEGRKVVCFEQKEEIERDVAVPAHT
ncbi:MAG: hypothetical protein AB7U20_20865 [Planctomycetaceae bacterium]